MSATVHTELPPDRPGHQGERRLAVALQKNCGPEFHLWFNLDYFPAARELDMLLCLEGVGVFAIEVKAVPLDEIESCGAKEMQFRRRTRSNAHPLQQAQAALWDLRDRLVWLHDEEKAEQNRLIPFISALAAFPLISRADFFARFGGTSLVDAQVNMLFKEDLEDGDSLARRLEQAILEPPIGPRRPDKWNLTSAQLQLLVDTLRPGGGLGPSQAERARAQVIDRPDSKSRQRIRGYLEPHPHQPVFFRGFPGTGKTIVLLQIARAHARAGRSVLFTCFNKVLAADVRRLLAATDLDPEDLKRIEVVHVSKMLARYGWPGKDREAERVWQLRRERSPQRSYDTVCIDEGQDLADWAYELIDWHAHRNETEWFIADGPGQELYLEAAGPRLSELRAAAREEKRIAQFNRVYRTAQIDFLVAQGVFEHAPALDKIEAWTKRHPLPAPKVEQGDAFFSSPLDLEFETRGLLPKIMRTAARHAPPHAPDSLYSTLLQLVPHELEAAADDGRPGDLAVLVHNVKDTRDKTTVIEALDTLGVAYIDQHDKKKRDDVLPAGKVRLVSFHSARGIEAHRTILVGFDDLDAQRHGKQLAYIALSRAKSSTTVLLRDGQPGPYSRFLTALIEDYLQ